MNRTVVTVAGNLVEHSAEDAGTLGSGSFAAGSPADSPVAGSPVAGSPVVGSPVVGSPVVGSQNPEVVGLEVVAQAEGHKEGPADAGTAILMEDRRTAGSGYSSVSADRDTSH